MTDPMAQFVIAMAAAGGMLAIGALLTLRRIRWLDKEIARLKVQAQAEGQSHLAAE